MAKHPAVEPSVPAQIVSAGVVASGPEPPVLALSTYYILAALADGDKHGYAIGKDVRWRSGGSIDVAIGNLYNTLKNLVDIGLIEIVAQETSPSGRGRKLHRLTVDGVLAFEANKERLRKAYEATVALRPNLSRPVAAVATNGRSAGWMARVELSKAAMDQ